MKKRKCLVAILATLVIILSGVFIYRKITNPFINITTNEYRELLNNNQEKLIYIGRPTCPSCQKEMPVLKELLNDMDVKAYYFNTDKAKKKDLDDFNKFKEEINLQYVPTIIYYDEDGKETRFDYENFQESDESLRNFLAQYY